MDRAPLRPVFPSPTIRIPCQLSHFDKADPAYEAGVRAALKAKGVKVA